MPPQSVITVPELEYWDVPKRLNPDGFYLVLGDRGKGKTSNTEYIMQLDLRINESIVVCMCGSAKVKANWRQSVARIHVVDPSVDYLRTMIKIQNMHTDKYTDLGLPLPYHLHVDLVLDDVALYAKIMKDDIFQELASSSRNLGMRIYVLCQYLMQVPKDSRGGFNAIILVGFQSEETLVDLYKKYANFMSKRLFVAAATSYLQNWGTFIIDRDNQKCYRLQAPFPLVHIPLGQPGQHKHSENHYQLLKTFREQEAERMAVCEDETRQFEDSKGIIIFEPRNVKTKSTEIAEQLQNEKSIEHETLCVINQNMDTTESTKAFNDQKATSEVNNEMDERDPTDDSSESDSNVENSNEEEEQEEEDFNKM